MLMDLLNVKVWAMEPNFFNRAYPIVRELLIRGEKDISRLNAINPNLNEGRQAALAQDKQRARRSNVALIPILGSLTKRGDLSSYGMQDYGNAIQGAIENPDIDAIVIEFDSPGGSVDGTEQLGKIIKNSSKPIVAFGDNLVASAAYWLASQATEIWSNADNLTELGSIGTLYIHENWQAFIEKEIGEVKIIRAPQSVDKAKVNVIEALAPEEEANIKQMLKDITNGFIQTVKDGRGDRLNTGEENIFTGKIYVAKEALQLGIIDSIGTLDEAISRAVELANTDPRYNKNQNSSNQSKSKNNMKFKTLASFFFGKAEEGASTEELTAEELASLEAAEQKLTALENEKTQLRTFMDNAKKALKVEDDDKLISAIEANVAELASSRGVLDAAQKAAKVEDPAKLVEAINALNEEPAAPTTTVVKDGDPDPAAEEKKKAFKTSVDEEAEKILKDQKEQMAAMSIT